MKTKINVEELENKIDFESVSNRLIKLAESGELKKRKTVADLLDRVRPALEQAREQKVSFAELTKFLVDSGITVSEPTLRQYLRGTAKKKSRQSKKKATPKTEPKTKTQAAPKAETKAAAKVEPKAAPKAAGKTSDPWESLRARPETGALLS